jgi:hypothetical protein
MTDAARTLEIGEAYKNFKGGLFIGDERYVYPPVSKIRSTVGRDFTPLKQLKKETLDNFTIIDRIRFHKLLYSSIFHKLRFTFDMEKGLNFGYTVIVAAIQIAVIKGHKDILLTGVDANYNSDQKYFKGADGRAQFNNESFLKNPRLYMEPILALVQVYLEEMGVRLVDCTPGGKLRLIRKGALIDHKPYYKVNSGY